MDKKDPFIYFCIIFVTNNNTNSKKIEYWEMFVYNPKYSVQFYPYIGILLTIKFLNLQSYGSLVIKIQIFTIKIVLFLMHKKNLI